MGETSLLADDFITYAENPKNSTTKKELEIISNYCKISEYKVNIHKATISCISYIPAMDNWN